MRGIADAVRAFWAKIGNCLSQSPSVNAGEKRPHAPPPSENDLRSFVTKRKISGGTMSRDGRVARDPILGLMKTCRKLGLSFYHYLGDRLGRRSG